MLNQIVRKSLLESLLYEEVVVGNIVMGSIRDQIYAIFNAVFLKVNKNHSWNSESR